MGETTALKDRDWKSITPEALTASVEHIRKMFDEAVFKCTWPAQHLCFAALHPDNKLNEKLIDLAEYEAFFRQYKMVIGPAAAQEFDRTLRIATPPAIFHAYLEAVDAGIRVEIRRLYGELLAIAMAHESELSLHPAEWAKTHLDLLLRDQKHRVVTWIKSVCDRQDLSKAFNTPEETEEFIFWNDWRAPKLIYMKPAGNLPYNEAIAWSREDEGRTKELLEARSSRFIQFLGFRLEELAGDAHLQLAKAKKEKQEMNASDSADFDRRFALMAIEEARKSVAEDDRPHPRVGAVVVKDGEVLSRAHRGEKPKSHAEFIALEDKLPDGVVAGSTVYTTLEPCTTRNHPKIPCAQRLIDRKVRRVVIGMLDPNPDIMGRGDQMLSDAGIEVQLFPRELRAQVEELNREFIRAQKRRQTTPSKPQPAFEADSQEYWEQRKKASGDRTTQQDLAAAGLAHLDPIFAVQACTFSKRKTVSTVCSFV